MAAEHRLETFPRDARTVVRWDPADPASVSHARAEFDRLHAEGYALFALEERGASSVERRTDEFGSAGGSFVARERLPIQTDAFRPEVERIVAVKPARGGA